MVKEQSRNKAVRRIAKRRGYTASRSRLQDPLAIGYGRWTITDREGRGVSPEDGWTLDEVERWLGVNREEDQDG